jgi:hypothetical protein
VGGFPVAALEGGLPQIVLRCGGLVIVPFEPSASLEKLLPDRLRLFGLFVFEQEKRLVERL